MDLFLVTLAESESVDLFPTLPHIIGAIVNFAIVAFVLYKFLHKPLLNAINAREESIEEQLRKAAEDREEAERLRKELEERLANAQREANEIISKATQAANAARAQIEAEAKARAEEMIANATRTIEREKAKALAELRAEVADLALMVASKVIEKDLSNHEEQRRLAERFLAEAGNN
ncbi:MAG TPA: F0F1 ATP synthase subunit B [Symbiobacteriaceae bacterium]